MTARDVYDVVVCGFGGAGAAAAIEAHDAGASVLVLEKADEGGGSTAVSGGTIATINDPIGALADYASVTEGRTPIAVLEAHVRGIMELPGWIEACGGRFGTYDLPRPAFPAFYLGTPGYDAHPHPEAIGRGWAFRNRGSNTVPRRCGGC